MPSLPLCSAVSEPVPSIVKSPEDTRSAALSPSAFSLFSPSTVRLRLESPTSIALSAPEAMFISFIVMFASASPSVETVMVLSVAFSLSRWVITVSLSATALLLPCLTDWPFSFAMTVMSPSSRYHVAASAVGIRHTASISATMEINVRFSFIGRCSSFYLIW